MKNIRIGEHNYSVPATWDTMTKEQLLALARITAHCRTTIEIQLKFLLHCTQGKALDYIGQGIYIMELGKTKHLLFSDEVTALLGVFDYLFTANENGETVLAPKLTINHFKKLRSRYVKLRGPLDRLDDITYNQFVWLQTYHSIIDANTPEYLDELINIIYKTKGGKQNSKNIKYINPHIKTVIMWFYLGTLNYLSERFPDVLSGGSSDGKELNVFDNQQRIIDSLAEGDVTRKDQVRESLLYDALYSMDVAAKRMKEMEKQHAK